MTFQRHGSFLVIFLILFSLVLVACERPLPGDQSIPPTPTEETGAQSGAYPGEADLTTPESEGEAGYPAEEIQLEDSAGDEAAAPEAYPAESGEASTEDAGSAVTDEEAALADTAAESEGSEETAAPEGQPAAETGGETVVESGSETPEATGEGAGGETAIAPADEAESAAAGETGSETAQAPESEPAAQETGTAESGAAVSEEAATETPEAAAIDTAGEATAEPAVETPAESKAAVGAEEIGTAESTVEAAPDNTSAAESAVVTEETLVEGPRTHIVAPGENLYRIGLQYGMSWVTLAEANNLTDASQITVGQELVIPDQVAEETGEPTSGAAATEEGTGGAEAAGETEITTEEVTEPESGANTYIVQAGDNLYRIGLKFGVTVTALVEANGLDNADRIYAGQELLIPDQVLDAASVDEGVEITHEVQAGETVFGVAFLYGISWTELVEINQIKAPYTLEEGQVLIISTGD